MAAATEALRDSTPVVGIATGNAMERNSSETPRPSFPITTAQGRMICGRDRSPSRGMAAYSLNPFCCNAALAIAGSIPATNGTRNSDPDEALKVFGLNGFLHFIKQPPPTGLALQYFSVLSASHYMVPVFALQVVGGALLLLNRFGPIALVLLGPVIANILLFHTLMAPEGLPPALVAMALWLVVFYSVRSAFAGVCSSAAR